jgi:hemerythrin superfamily protein
VHAFAIGYGAEMTDTSTPSSATDGDVVAFLQQQHDQVRTLLDEVVESVGSERQQSFDAVRELLARHETAEEIVVRPLTRKAPAGDRIAQARMDEENEAKKALAELEKLDVSSPEFSSAFTPFRTAVRSHADAEEQIEFPLLRQHTDEDTLAGAQAKVALAEQTAPTHPHPSAKTTAMNYIAGPFAAMLDRARDAFSKSK